MRHLRQLAVPAVGRGRAARYRLWRGWRAAETPEVRTGPAGRVDTTSQSYMGGFEVCSEGTVAEIAEIYGVPEKTSDAVATVIAEQLAGSSAPGRDRRGQTGLQRTRSPRAAEQLPSPAHEARRASRRHGIDRPSGARGRRRKPRARSLRPPVRIVGARRHRSGTSRRTDAGGRRPTPAARGERAGRRPERDRRLRGRPRDTLGARATGSRSRSPTRRASSLPASSLCAARERGGGRSCRSTASTPRSSSASRVVMRPRSTRSCSRLPADRFAAARATSSQHVTVEEALAHPTWSMGRKITVD